MAFFKKVKIFEKIKSSLTRTRKSLVDQVKELTTLHKKIDGAFFDELLDILILGDMGVETSEKLIDQLKRTVKRDKIRDAEEIINLLKAGIQDILKSDIVYTAEIPDKRPYVIMLTGVNGSGKTTTAGKFARRYKDAGLKVMMIAADTFRAAAIEQLEIWAQRADVDIVKQKEGSDPSAVIFDGLQKAVARNYDVVIADTAGRLQNKSHLMKELEKIKRTSLKKVDEDQILSLLVLDATTGQNAVSQALIFNDAVKLDGIVLAKLDGTAKGGIVVTIKDRLGLPVLEAGVGEKIDDLIPFDTEAYVDGLFG
ncbi:signal recognition particle-docking protein FtsY [bacterium]|nr:signal recognition particle-docking protein FtsY [bacterium]